MVLSEVDAPNVGLCTPAVALPSPESRDPLPTQWCDGLYTPSPVLKFAQSRNGLNDSRMPALRVFGRRQLAIASDDLPLPSCSGVAVRLLLLAALAFAAAHLPDESEGSGSQHALRGARTYVFAMMAVLLASSLSMSCVFVHSLRGTIIDDGAKRALVAPLLKLSAGTVLLEGATNVAGSAVAVRALPADAGADAAVAMLMIRVVVGGVWLLVTLFFTCGYLTVSNTRVRRRYRSLSGVGLAGDLEEDLASAHAHAHAHERERSAHDGDHASDDEGMSWSVTRNDWEHRCRRMCRCWQLLTCNVFGNSYNEASDATYRDVANVMARFFKGTDLIPSDLVAALCLLRAEQRSRESAAVRDIISRHTVQPTLSPDSAIEDGHGDDGDGDGRYVSVALDTYSHLTACVFFIRPSNALTVDGTPLWQQWARRERRARRAQQRGVVAVERGVVAAARAHAPARAAFRLEAHCARRRGAHEAAGSGALLALHARHLRQAPLHLHEARLRALRSDVRRRVRRRKG